VLKRGFKFIRAETLIKQVKVQGLNDAKAIVEWVIFLLSVSSFLFFIEHPYIKVKNSFYLLFWEELFPFLQK
jgi:hypothetical protein